MKKNGVLLKLEDRETDRRLRPKKGNAEKGRATADIFAPRPQTRREKGMRVVRLLNTREDRLKRTRNREENQGPQPKSAPKRTALCGA